MPTRDRSNSYFFRTPGRMPLYTDRPPFWQRRSAPTNALGMVLLATILAIVVAFVATLVYAQVDASRPIGEQVENSQPPQTAPPPTQEGPTTTKAPEALSPDDLARKVATAVRGVQTLDESGQPVQGTAFVVGSFNQQTLLVTSLAVVRASTRTPSPTISLSPGGEATLWTWQEEKDLALLVIGGNAEALSWVSGSTGLKTGDRIWAGTAGQDPAPGEVTAVSDTGIEHNIVIDGARQGAPLVNQRGEIVGVASRAYNPGGRATETLFIGVPIRATCERVLRCGTGNTSPEATTTTPP